MDPDELGYCPTNEEVRVLFLELAEQRLAAFPGGFRKFKAAAKGQFLLEQATVLRNDLLATILVPHLLQKRLLDVIDSWAETHLGPIEPSVPALPNSHMSTKRLGTNEPRAFVNSDRLGGSENGKRPIRSETKEALDHDKKPATGGSVHPRVGWQLSLWDAWPTIQLSLGGRTPNGKEAIRFLRGRDTSGRILQKGDDRELWWQPDRGDAKHVALRTVQNVISHWKRHGATPGGVHD